MSDDALDRAGSGHQDTPPGRPGGLHTIPIKLGDVTVGWTSEELARRVSQTPTPHLLITPVRLDVLGLRTHKRFVAVPQSAITYISSEGGLVTAFTDQGQFWTDLTLTNVEQRLDPRRFLRLDASHLVNVTRIVELIPWTHQRYRLVFGDAAKSELVMSRDVGRRLRKVLGW